MDLRNTALASERLSLRSFTPGDAPEIFAAVTPTLTRFMVFDPSPSLVSFSEVWRIWLPNMAAGTDLYLVVRATGSGEFLGLTGLHGIGAPEPEAGIWIKESAHGSGFGREAVSTLVGWAGRVIGVRSILYSVAEENRPSRRVAESLGAHVVGTSKLPKAGGVLHPMLVYRIPVPQSAV
ncbi:GNAT family N-acetyltransferase [Azospirillum sp. SYSU D00513]|uniref:GNAT family N-acetyltransferase n=1 Tax=Azospirillum sp. SYSU D00513 TaxID=2812561 RepID=UPI001A9570F4|nr:GNAT family N-acetyltransferase [Azospirillum sp. SYSU D00513]